MNEEVLICIAGHLRTIDAIHLARAFPNYHELAKVVIAKADVTMTRVYKMIPTCDVCNELFVVREWSKIIINCDSCTRSYCYRCARDWVCGCNAEVHHCRYCYQDMRVFEMEWIAELNNFENSVLRGKMRSRCKFGDLIEQYGKWQASKN